MPSSHGGGSHSSGGSFHTSGSGSSRTFSSTSSFPGATRYTYRNRYGRTCFFYSSVAPRRQTLLSCLIGPIIMIVFALFIGYLSLSEMFPQKLDAEYCTPTGYYVDDYAGVFDDTTELKQALASFYDKTGVEPYVYTNTKQNLIREGYSFSDNGVENFAYAVYVNTFSDEGHYVFVFIVEDESNWIWCDMAGDNTSNVVTDVLFDTLQATLQNALDDTTTPFEDDFTKTVNVMTEDALTSKAIDYRPMIVGGIVVLVFVGLGVYSIVNNVQARNQMNDYMDFRQKNPNAPEDLFKDDYGYSTKVDDNSYHY